MLSQNSIHFFMYFSHTAPWSKNNRVLKNFHGLSTIYPCKAILDLDISGINKIFNVTKNSVNIHRYEKNWRRKWRENGVTVNKYYKSYGIKGIGNWWNGKVQWKWLIFSILFCSLIVDGMMKMWERLFSHSKQIIHFTL